MKLRRSIKVRPLADTDFALRHESHCKIVLGSPMQKAKYFSLGRGRDAMYAFGPEQLQNMGAAYDRICSELNCEGLTKDDVARQIIRVARTGEADYTRLFELAVSGLLSAIQPTLH
jgi:hypothetical protein